MNSPRDRSPLARYGWAWVPIPLLLTVMVVLWVADPRTSFESRGALVTLNVVFSWLVSMGVGYVAGRGFVANGQSGLVMLGCGALLWGLANLAASALMDAPGNLTITVHNLGTLGAALCHVTGLLWHGRARRPGRWLVTAYGSVAVVVLLLVWGAMSGWTPVFFVEGQGGTVVRQVVLLSTIAMFALAAWMMLAGHGRTPWTFLYWYGLGLALLAAGLAGVMAQSVHGSLLGWTGRITQYLGGAYLLVAAATATRATGTWTISLTTVEDAWRTKVFRSGFQRPAPWGWVWRYGLAVAATGVALGLRLAVTAWVGPGLPTYITFYPATMVAALLGGFGPGLLSTALAGFAVVYWVLPPVGEFAIASPVERLGLVIFGTMGVFMSGTAVLYRRDRDKVAAYDREAALREGRARLATFAEATFEGIVESEAGRIEDCNEQFARMLGYTVSALRGMEIANLTAPEDRDRVAANIGEGRESTIEHAALRKDGTRIVVEARGRSVSAGSARRHTAVRDITERKQAEERTQASLREKEVLLKEIHHRVKNTLQVISSLVDLQAAALDNPALYGLFQNVRDRVRSMALIHEKLYQSESLARVDFAEYARSLLNYLWRAHGRSEANIRLALDLQVVWLSVETAVPCGLILNELATNALKHAFRDRSEGEVAVELHAGADGLVRLRVRDNGVGLPAGLDWQQSRSLGIRLVQMLAKQLNGTVEASTNRGAEFRLTFDPRAPEPSEEAKHE